MGSLALQPTPRQQREQLPALLARFDAPRFLVELRDLQPPPLPRTAVPERAALVTLYARFLATEHFRLWWEDRRAHAVALATFPSASGQAEAGVVTGGAP